jgi:hypothetical protein
VVANVGELGPKQNPKEHFGPYLLYACLAAWHFEIPSWLMLVVALLEVILTGMALLKLGGEGITGATSPFHAI